ncbi:membrane cofactor protein isoform X4 [Amia ocellicauda]|uniref:membrane cofactor protein isoform X4 n=1 Tax=Amia ocellicauda TaxID=2972642 RepID=UPI0034647AE1
MSGRGLRVIELFVLLLPFGASSAGQCPVFQVSPPILMTAASQALNDYPDGTSLTFECQAGYFRSGGSPKITCSNSVWSPLTLMCDKKNCGSPGEILNGGFDLSEGTLFGAKATGHCDEGYQIVGRKVRLCLADGWSGEVPRCEVVKCEEPPSIPDGTQSPQQPIFEYGAVVKYTCNRGFDMVGNENGESVCSADGTFKPAPPECKVIECPNPTLEFGYKVTGRVSPYRKNHQITFKCNDGYTMNGSSTVTCGENGWSPAIPTCFTAPIVPTTISTTSKASTTTKSPVTGGTNETPHNGSPDGNVSGGVIAAAVITPLVLIGIGIGAVVLHNMKKKEGSYYTMEKTQEAL